MFVEHKEVGEVTEAPAKTMKLSEAIRIGAARWPQTNDYRGCALGVAAKVMRVETSGDLDIFCQRIRLPRHLWRPVLDRNDSGESREQIADWLEAQGY